MKNFIFCKLGKCGIAEITIYCNENFMHYNLSDMRFEEIVEKLHKFSYSTNIHDIYVPDSGLHVGLWDHINVLPKSLTVWHHVRNNNCGVQRISTALENF